MFERTGFGDGEDMDIGEESKGIKVAEKLYREGCIPDPHAFLEHGEAEALERGAEPHSLPFTVFGYVEDHDVPPPRRGRGGRV